MEDIDKGVADSGNPPKTTETDAVIDLLEKTARFAVAYFTGDYVAKCKAKTDLHNTIEGSIAHLDAKNVAWEVYHAMDGQLQKLDT